MGPTGMPAVGTQLTWSRGDLQVSWTLTSRSPPHRQRYVVVFKIVTNAGTVLWSSLAYLCHEQRDLHLYLHQQRRLRVALEATVWSPVGIKIAAARQGSSLAFSSNAEELCVDQRLSFSGLWVPDFSSFSACSRKRLCVSLFWVHFIHSLPLYPLLVRGTAFCLACLTVAVYLASGRNPKEKRKKIHSRKQDLCNEYGFHICSLTSISNPS